MSTEELKWQKQNSLFKWFIVLSPYYSILFSTPNCTRLHRRAETVVTAMQYATVFVPCFLVVSSFARLVSADFWLCFRGTRGIHRGEDEVQDRIVRGGSTYRICTGFARTSRQKRGKRVPSLAYHVWISSTLLLFLSTSCSSFLRDTRHFDNFDGPVVVISTGPFSMNRGLLLDLSDFVISFVLGEGSVL